MTKPNRFTHRFVASRNVPYECIDEQWRSVANVGGVLGKGTSVWLELYPAPRPSTVPAWVEEVGVVSVDARCLMPENTSTPPRMTQLPSSSRIGMRLVHAGQH